MMTTQKVLKFVSVASVAAAVAVSAAACGPANGAEQDASALVQTASTGAVPPAVTCEVADAPRALPEQVRESSGLALSRRDAGVFWTHNDAGNDPVLYALDRNGSVTRTVRVAGASLVDWEDIESGQCDGGACLFVGDIGDNDGERSSIVVYEIAEPTADGASAAAVARSARYPDRPQDAEGLFRLPDGELYLVTKGRHGPISLFRFPAESGGTLEKVRDLMPQPSSDTDRVTAATASPDGRWVAIRTSTVMMVYPAADLVGGGAVEPAMIDLRPLREAQGEALTIGEDGSVWLTSEAENKGSMPAWSRLQCRFPAEN